MLEGVFRLAAIAVIFLPASLARGSDLRTGASESDLVVTGRVVAVREAPDALGRMEWLEAEVRVEEVWKGSVSGASVRVLSPAGGLAAPGLALEGSARFLPGERVLLFLIRQGERYRPWRTVFGKYPIQGQGSEASVAGTITGLADPDDFEAGQSSLALDEVRATIRNTVATADGGSGLDLAWRRHLR
jgi:hypothetical protein